MHTLKTRCISSPFEILCVAFADAAWANRCALTSQCGYLCPATDEFLFAWTRCTVQTDQLAQQRLSTSRSELGVQGRMKEIGRRVSRIPGALLTDAKGIHDAVKRSDRAANMIVKRSAVEGLALRQSSGTFKKRR